VKRVAAAVSAALVLFAASPARAGTVTIDTVARSDGFVTITGTASFEGDPTGPTKVIDIPPGPSNVPLPFAEFRAGWVGETPDALTFSWQTDPFPFDVPEVVQFFWDFQLTAPDASSESFQLNATLSPAGNRGHIDVPGAVVTVTDDPSTNTITASVRRQDLTSGDTPLAVDGARLDDTRIFVGPAVCLGPVVQAALCNGGYSTRTYVLGPHVEGTLVPAGATPDPSDFRWALEVALPAPDGGYTLPIPTWYNAGPTKAIVQACTGGHCGPIVASDPFVL
jgi:hypothetical protein